ncbi:hypothetical protein [Pseudomonas congelans]|nr:hypothetical protein [Pseudomonas congelans]
MRTKGRISLESSHPFQAKATTNVLKFSWAGVDASLQFNVSATGKLNKRAIEDNTQSDGRCGLKCQECSWEVFGKDVEDDTLLEVIQNADQQWQGLQLSVFRAKP